jgi:hypothetical protein
MANVLSEHWQIFLGRESNDAKIWRDYKALRWAHRITAPFVLFPVLSNLLSLPLLVRVAGWMMVAVWVYSCIRLVMWQCPRCKRRFFAKELPYRRGWRPGLPSEQRCLNCGLLRP